MYAEFSPDQLQGATEPTLTLGETVGQEFGKFNPFNRVGQEWVKWRELHQRSNDQALSEGSIFVAIPPRVATAFAETAGLRVLWHELEWSRRLKLWTL